MVFKVFGGLGPEKLKNLLKVCSVDFFWQRKLVQLKVKWTETESQIDFSKLWCFKKPKPVAMSLFANKMLVSKPNFQKGYKWIKHAWVLLVLFLHRFLKDTCSDTIWKCGNVRPKEELTFFILLLSLGYWLFCTVLATLSLQYLSSCARLILMKVMEHTKRRRWLSQENCGCLPQELFLYFHWIKTWQHF